MALRLIWKDDKSPDGNSPTIFVDEETRDLVIQGYRLDTRTEEEVHAAGNVPDYENVVRVPAHVVDAIRKACDVSDGGDQAR
ncbi:hypothetical protein [Streptomyces sp. BE303]|uniref:hypothetical protein n=1 Tax=Streptomyces sp. BE303 TaxID=3002528 RepID=UPI002E786DB8|nr:hypothetical protein [Streptomyces sp. BE303]MED7953030.1 hypothetical protein [Streptomyces sp. BE303]